MARFSSASLKEVERDRPLSFDLFGDSFEGLAPWKSSMCRSGLCGFASTSVLCVSVRVTWLSSILASIRGPSGGVTIATNFSLTSFDSTSPGTPTMVFLLELAVLSTGVGSWGTSFISSVPDGSSKLSCRLRVPSTD